MGSECRGCGVCTGYGLGEANAEGKAILDFSVAFSFTIAKLVLGSEEYLITYKNRAFCTQVDFLFYKEIGQKALHELQSLPWREHNYPTQGFGYVCIS